jgi:hypothetical protein
LACGAVPVPVSMTIWGDPVTLSETLRVALFAPAAAGVKVTEIAQEIPAARVDPQLEVSAKAEALAPARVMPVMDMDALPVLVSVVFSEAEVPTAVLGNESGAGAREAPGALTLVPVPCRVMLLVAPPMALLPTAMEPVRAPGALGVKVTVSAQVVPEDREVRPTHVPPVTAKSPVAV